jgi:polyisoprenoid-binding protein YceI
MLISQVTGKFSEFSGSIQLSDDNFTNAQISGTVAVNSIDTDNDRRDKHLKNEDFFLANEYPEMTFKSSKIEKIGKDTYAIIGDLTINNITKSVTFDTQHGGTITVRGSRRMGWHATTTINRFDFGLKWNKTLETGGLVVGEIVIIEISAEFIEQNH